MFWKKDEMKEMQKMMAAQDAAIKTAESKSDRLDDLIDKLKDRLEVEVEMARKRGDIELLNTQIANPAAVLRQREASAKKQELAVPDTIPNLEKPKGRPRK